jgi:signal transduction histidine kinase
MRIKAKLTIVILTLLLLLAITIGGLAAWNSSKYLQKSIGDNQLVLVKNIMAEIDRTIYDKLVNIQSMSEDKEFERSLSGYKTFLESQEKLDELLLLTGPWDELQIFDTTGVVRVAGDQTYLRKNITHFGTQKKKTFEHAINGEIYYSDFFISPNTNKPGLLLAAPIRDESLSSQPVVGVVIGLLSWPLIEEIIQETSITTITLHNSNALLLATNDPRTKRKYLTDTGNFQIVQHALNVPGMSMLTKKGRDDVLISHVKQQGHLRYKGNNWVLTLTRPKDIAFLSIRKSIINILLTITVTIILAIGAALWLSQIIIHPIEKLHQATEELERGNFKVNIEIKSGDEVEELAEALNKTAKSLTKMNLEHKQLERAKTEFLSITSHELRSPMTSMRAQLQMLIGTYYGKLNQKQIEALSMVLRNTERLDNIIIDFLEISRIEAARLKFNFVKTNLVALINLIIEEMKVVLAEKEIEIISATKKLPIIEVDPDRVGQILRNLINNSLKFSRQNGTILVKARKDKNFILFSVQDTGIGISSQAQARIFEPFFQEEKTIYREHSGTGLGLAICRGIVESQGGNIWVKSTKNKGATFYFTIPLKPIPQVKPVKLLFSKEKNIHLELKNLFIEMLGPSGGIELDYLEKHGSLNLFNLDRYISDIVDKKIIDTEKGQRFKFRLQEIYQKIDHHFNKKDKIRSIFLEELGPLGLIEFNKIKKLNFEEISDRIRFLKTKGILNKEEENHFMLKIKDIMSNFL